MRSLRPALLTAALALALPAALAAQNSECDAYTGNIRRVCDAGVDGTRAFHPIAGLLVSGGNPVLGTARSLGGLGHLSLTARVNAVKVTFPELSYDGSTDTVSAGDDIIAPAPLIEGALGVYRGLSSGFLAVDLLASAQLLPTTQVDGLTVDPDARRVGSVALGLGYGARIGILRGSFVIPSISVSVMRRDIPQIQYGDVDGGDTYSYAVDLQATNVRAAASWKFAVLGLAAGLGWDKYTGDARIEFEDPGLLVPRQTVDIKLDNTRVMAFVDAALDFPIVKIVGEAGYQLGKDQRLTTQFEDFDTTQGKFFAGVGLRLGF